MDGIVSEKSAMGNVDYGPVPKKNGGPEEFVHFGSPQGTRVDEGFTDGRVAVN